MRTTFAPRHRYLVTAAVAALALVACSGDDESASDEQAIVLEGADGAASATSEATGGTADAPVDEEAAAREFATCMRDNGVEDFPDPTVDADGSVNFGANPGAGPGAGGLFDDPDFDSATEACNSLLEGASFLPGQGDTTEINDQLLAAAECLREQGLDVEDPNLSGGFDPSQAGNVFGDDFDPNDPAVQDAIDACQSVFTDLGGGN